MKKKTILCKGHGPLQNYTQTCVPWEDVWISWKEGRKKCFDAPVLVSKLSLIQDIEVNDICHKNNPDMGFDKDAFELSLIKESFDLGLKDVIVTNMDSQSGPCVYTKQDYIDRKEAEKMLRVLLCYRGVVSDLKFSWVRNDFLAYPVG